MVVVVNDVRAEFRGEGKTNSNTTDTSVLAQICIKRTYYGRLAVYPFR